MRQKADCTRSQNAERTADILRMLTRRQGNSQGGAAQDDSETPERNREDRTRSTGSQAAEAHMTRETWLLQLTDRLRPLFVAAGFTLPKNIRVSCGWPTRRAIVATGKSRTLGQCFPTSASAEGRVELFITPALADGFKVAEVLTHELCHTIDNCESGHGPAFRRVATAVGLCGKMTATVAAPALADRLNGLLEILPPYPHVVLDMTKGQKKEGTRLIKIECQECGWTARTTQKWIDEGLPTCACGAEMIESPPPEPKGKRKKKPGKPLHEVFSEPQGKYKIRKPKKDPHRQSAKKFRLVKKKATR
jgi:hypothetical protein